MAEKKGSDNVSIPKYDWYGHAVKQLRKYPKKLELEETAQSKNWIDAIKKAIEETETMPDGKERMWAVKMRYFEHTHTIDGIALKIGASRNTVIKWTADFAYLAGKNAGY